MVYIILSKNTNTLVVNYYFESEDDCKKYMHDNWFKRKYEIVPLPKFSYSLEINPISFIGSDFWV